MLTNFNFFQVVNRFLSTKSQQRNIPEAFIVGKLAVFPDCRSILANVEELFVKLAVCNIL